MQAPLLRHSFRTNPMALWRQVSPVWLGTASALSVAHWLAGTPLAWPAILQPSFAVAAMVAVLFLFRPVRISAEGVFALNRLGFPRFMAWHSVAEVGFGRRHPLEPGFQLRDVDGRKRWIPRHTMRLREMQQLAVRFGGREHPLARALETPVCDAP